MRLFINGPNCIMDSSRACLVASELTEPMSCPFCFRGKDRSRMVLNSHDLCGIIAIGDILSFSGVFPLMFPYRKTLAYIFLIFSEVLTCRAFMAAGEFSEGCGPQHRLASMWSVDQSRL